MGSLASRPKAPAIQQPQIITIPVYTPAPVSTAAPSGSVSSSSTISSPASEPSSVASEPTDDQVKTQARNAGLLSRSRGVLSTVLTGFRGVLSDSGNKPQRKTLLGE